MREAATRAFGQGPFSAAAFRALHELTRKNLAAFTQALGLFAPFAGRRAAPSVAPPKAETSAPSADIDELKAQLTEMRRRLDTLSEKS